MSLPVRIPAPKGTSQLITDSQTVDDLTGLMCTAVDESLEDAAQIAAALNGPTRAATLLRFFHFLRGRVRYQREPAELQTVATLARTLSEGRGDCKHLSTCFASLCKVAGIPVKFKTVSYKYPRRKHTHVYCVAFVGGRWAPFDLCLPKPATEKRHLHANLITC